MISQEKRAGTPHKIIRLNRVAPIVRMGELENKFDDFHWWPATALARRTCPFRLVPNFGLYQQSTYRFGKKVAMDAFTRTRSTVGSGVIRMEKCCPRLCATRLTGGAINNENGLPRTQ